jgi:cobalamin biosynthesis Co2+ chelatase CbiK
MYQNDYNKALEHIKTSIEVVKDHQNIMRCEQAVLDFSRETAWKCIQDLIYEYESEIVLFGALCDGKTIYRNINPNTLSDDELRRQLVYIARHIPIYVLMRKGEEELAKRICQWIDRR